MAISVARAERHVEEWTKALAKFNSLVNWPRFLFHHCQAEVAAAILSEGKLTCRGKVGALICDVANQAALGNNPAAHAYARLYFRPKNWFHFKTEGIKSRTDRYRVDPHMTIPVALVFDFVGVMTRDDSAFVYGNFAKTLAAPQTGDKAFDKLDFKLIYHDGALKGAAIEEINNIRMSEVVVPDGLDLKHLSCVVCRTAHDVRTLEHMLQQAGVRPPKIIVEQNGSMFMRKGIFIDEIYNDGADLIFAFHSPVQAAREKYDIKVTRDGGVIGNYELGASRWRVKNVNAKPPHVWRVEIEGCLAYEGTVPGQPLDSLII